MHKTFLYNILIIAFVALTTSTAQAQQKIDNAVRDSICLAIREITLPEVAGSYVQVESVRLRERGKSRSVEVRTSVELAYFPMRPESVKRLYDAVRAELPAKYRNYTLLIYSNGQLIDNLIPHYYRKKEGDKGFTNSSTTPLITRCSSISQPTEGLLNRHIAL